MKKKIALYLALALCLGLLAGCGAADKGEASVQSVSMICGMGSVGLSDRFAGVVSPQGETEIKTDGNTAIGEIKVKVGDEVQEGQPLFTYDTAQASMELEKANLELQRMKNELEDKESEKAKYEEALADLHGDDQKPYLLLIREANADIVEKKYNISAKNMEINKLAATLKNVTVTSPVSGVVKTLNESGSGYDDMGNPQPFMTIVETGGYRVKGYVNENNAAALQQGMDVLLRSRVDERVWHGTISEIDWNNPAQNNNYNYYGDDDTARSSKYPFYVVLNDSNGLLLGQHVYIEPDYGQEAVEDANTIHLPEWYIVDAEGSPYVWAQGANGKLEKRSITLGDYDADLCTYVVLSGLTPEDYIAFPDDTLTPGMTCVTYDEANFSGDDMMAYADDTYYGDGETGMMPEGAAEPAIYAGAAAEPAEAEVGQG